MGRAIYGSNQTERYVDDKFYSFTRGKVCASIMCCCTIMFAPNIFIFTWGSSELQIEADFTIKKWVKILKANKLTF